MTYADDRFKKLRKDRALKHLNNMNQDKVYGQFDQIENQADNQKPKLHEISSFSSRGAEGLPKLGDTAFMRSINQNDLPLEKVQAPIVETPITTKATNRALPTSNYIKNEQTGEVVSLQGDDIINQDRDGNIIDGQSQKFSLNPNKPNQVGNLDVAFDDSVDQASRSRFLKNPNKPAYNNKPQGASAAGQIVRKLHDQAQQDNNSNSKAQLYTEENAPNMPWKERMALNKQTLANQQSGEDATTRSDSNQNIADGRQAIAAERNNILRETNTLKGMVPPKPTTEVIKVDDGQGGYKEQIMMLGSDNQFHSAMGDQQRTTPTAAVIAQMIAHKGNKSAEALYMKRYGRLPY